MKLLRTIRLDPSDTFVFERAAEPGEWAVPGAFVFLDAETEGISVIYRRSDGSYGLIEPVLGTSGRGR